MIKEIPKHPGYFCDEMGNVFSTNGKGAKGKMKQLSIHFHKFGYKLVWIGKSQLVHRLVLQTFVGPCPKGYEASHLNGKSNDCRLDNLKWESRSDNFGRKKEHGTENTGTRCTFSRYNEKTILDIRELLKTKRQCDVARMLNVSKHTVWQVAHNKVWKWL